MRICQPEEYGVDGWVTIAECHGCGDFTSRALFVENEHESVLVLCGQCIKKIADAWLERFAPLDSRA